MGRGLHEEVRTRRGRGHDASPPPEGVVPLLRRCRQERDATAVDRIGSGPERAPGRFPALLVSVALVLGLAGYAGDAALNRRELDALLERVADAQSQVAYSNARISAAVDYTTPLLFRASLEPRVRASLQQIVTDAAAGQVAAMRQQHDRLDATRVLPWHGDLVRARAALAHYLDGRVTYLRAVAADFDALYGPHPELDRLLARARDAFLAATTERSRILAAFAGGTHPA